MKKLMSLALALLIVLGGLSFAALAEDDREDVTFLMYSDVTNDSGTLDGLWWTDFLYDELKIRIELMPEDKTKMVALIASNALPDIVIFEKGEHMNMAAEAGQLLDLAQFKDLMPHTQTDMMQTAMQYAADVFGGGVQYFLPNNIGESGGSLNFTISTRWDLYKEMGCPEMKDMWDYLDVLKEMQEKWPVTEDGQKVYAIASFPEWDSKSMGRADDFCRMDGVFHNTFYQIECDFHADELTVTDALAPDSKYVEGLKWYFTANQMGILDPDSITLTWGGYQERAAAGRIYFSPWLWGVSSYNTPEREEACIGFEPVFPSEYAAEYEGTNPVGGTWCWAIPKNCSNPERAAEYLDLMCDPDKTFILANGPEGVTWEMNDDGIPQLTDFGEEVALDSSIQIGSGGTLGEGLALINSYPIRTGNFSEKYNSVISSSLWETHEPVLTNLAADWAAYYGTDNVVKILTEQCKGVERPLAWMLLTDSNDEELVMISSAIGDLVKTQSWLAIFAEDEDAFNSIISKMHNDAVALGLETLQQAGFNAFDEAKAMAEKYQ